MIASLRWLDEVARSTAKRIGWLPPFVARVCVGLVFASTGLGKLRHLDGVIEFFRSLGIPAAELQAPFVAATELSCGVLLVVGLGTRFAALPLIGTMVVAIGTAIWPELDGAIDLLGREEFLLALLLGWLSVTGSGAISFDAAWARRRGARSGRSPMAIARCTAPNAALHS